MRHELRIMVKDLLEEAYFAGYYDAVGDCEDYDHDPTQMASEGFEEWFNED